MMKSIQLLLALPLVSAFSIDASSRRGFLTQSTAAIASLVATPIVAHAEDVDDLAMPSEEDEKARIVSITHPTNKQYKIWLKFKSTPKISTTPREQTTFMVAIRWKFAILEPFKGVGEQ